MNIPAPTQERIARIEKDGPDVFMESLYPRVYTHLGGFCSPKKLMESFAFSYAMLFLMPEKITDKRLLATTDPALGYMAARRMPFLFVHHNFLEAIKATDFKDPLNWMTMKLPYEHGILCLPESSPYHFILWSRILGNGEVPSFICGRDIRLDQPLQPRLHLHICEKIPDFPDYTPNWPRGNFAQRVSAITDEIPIISTDLRELKSLDTPKESLSEHRERWSEYGRVFFGTMLALTTRPELLEKEHLEKVVKASDGKRKEFWIPNIVGRNFTTKRLGSTGTHASPRFHWRRGHFRNQACGVGMKDHKVIWLEPVMVGVE